MPSRWIKDISCQVWHSLNLYITILSPLLKRREEESSLNKMTFSQAASASLLWFLGNMQDWRRFSCRVSVVLCKLSAHIPSQVSNQPLWKCPLEQLTHQCVPIQSDLKSVLQPPLAPELCAASPLMQTGYKLSQLRKSPPSTSFYLPIGRWMVEIRIPGETWDGENRNKDFPMSGTDVSFSTAFPFHPKGSCQTEARRTRAHIIPF